MTDVFLEQLRRRLTGALPGRDAQLRMAPQPRIWPDAGTPLSPAAALLLLYPGDHGWCVPLTVRVSGLRHHGGQVSLPGGRLDHVDEVVEQAALREAHEEIGVRPADVELLGRLTPLPIAISGHLLSPVVGVAHSRPLFTLAAAEVDRLMEVPLVRLTDPGIVGTEDRRRERPPHDVMRVPFFDIDGVRVWGATAMVLAEFIAVLPSAD